MHLLGCAPLLALTASMAAQGQVHVVDDGARDRGAVWMLDLNPDGTLQSSRELADGLSGLDGLHDRDEFGSAIAGIGDLDGNGVADLAVGAPGESRGRGAVWILFRAADGSVASQRALRAGRDGIAALAGAARFGAALAHLGDLDGDGTLELAVGAPGRAGEVSTTGELRILSLAGDGSVAREVRVAEGAGGFGGDLDAGDSFGKALGALGDLDGDGVADLAVGAPGDDDGGTADSGALWLLFLDAAGGVASHRELSRTAGGLGAGPAGLGVSVCALGDVDGNGTLDLAAGAASSSVWILRLHADGTVLAKQELRHGIGGLSNPTFGSFGAAVAPLGDLDADGVPDLAAGAPGNGTPSSRSTVFLLRLNPNGTVKGQQELETLVPGHDLGDALGAGLAALGDLDLDGRLDLASGAGLREGVPDPGRDFARIQDAVTAAAEGDTLLVRDGRYGWAGITAKSLSVVGDAGPRADGVEGRVEVWSLGAYDLAPAQRVVFSDLEVRGTHLAGNAGLVWLEDLEGMGLIVDRSTDVVLARCTFRRDAEVRGYALTIDGASRLHAYDCTFEGSPGVCGLEPLAAYPGISAVLVRDPPALHLDAAALHLFGCTVLGGDGVLCTDGSGGQACSGGGDGVTADPRAIVRVLDSVSVGGDDGCGFPYSGQGASYAGPVELLPGESLAFDSGSPWREGEDAVLAFRGPPGAAIWLLASLSSWVEPRPTWRGPLLLGTPRVLEFMGTTDASGVLDVLVPLGLLAPSFDVRRTFLQPLMIELAHGHARERPSRATPGAGSAFLVLDHSF